MDQSYEIVMLVDGVFGPDAIGIYLHGSSVLGGLRPASDVDVLVVSRRPMDEKQRHTLLQGYSASLAHGTMPAPSNLSWSTKLRFGRGDTHRPQTFCMGSGSAQSTRPAVFRGRI